jgi:hypothetical protein
MKWIGINGILSDGSDSVDLLLYEMEERGHDVHDFTYPRRNVITGRRRKHQFNDAWKLMGESEDGDSVFAHSRGGLIVFRAMQSGRKFKDVWLFAPAMPRDWRFPAGAAEQIFVVHNPLDRAIWKTRMLIWGDLGTMGSEGSSFLEDHPERGKNIMRPNYGEQSHNFYFLPNEVNFWADALENRGQIEGTT